MKVALLALAPQSTNAKNAKMTGLSTQQTAVNVEPISSNN
jgi:hypothetical protein